MIKIDVSNAYISKATVQLAAWPSGMRSLADLNAASHFAELLLCNTPSTSLHYTQSIPYRMSAASASRASVAK